MYRFRLTNQPMVSSHSELPGALHGAEMGLPRRDPSGPYRTDESFNVYTITVPVFVVFLRLHMLYAFAC